MKKIETKNLKILIEDEAIEEAEGLYVCIEGCYKDWIEEELIIWGFPENKKCPNCGEELKKISEMSEK